MTPLEDRPGALVTRLQVLKSWFDACLAGQAEFTADGAAEFTQQLGVALAEAEKMEQTGLALAGSLEHFGAAMRGVQAAMAHAAPVAAAPEDGVTAPDNVVPFRPRHRLHPAPGGSAA